LTSEERPPPEDEFRRAASYVLDSPGADHVEVALSASLVGLTRYAGSEIIQNTVRDEVRADVRVVVDDRIATASTNQLSARSMKRAARRALEAARASRPDRDYPGPARPSEVGRPHALMRWDAATAACTPSQRAAEVGRVLHAARDASAAGIYETSAHAYSFMSSTGVDCHDRYTRCVTTCLLERGSSTGWADASSHTVEDVDVEAAARRAYDKAALGEVVADAEPGSYEVVLEPSAVATLVEYLSYAGFGAKQVLDGESFLSVRAGDDVAAPEVTIADDVAHPASVGIGFDFEGVPRSRVAVIERGRATRPVNDLRTAPKLGHDLTGHSSGSNEFGPYASNLVVEPGVASTEELIGSVDDGVLVTRFHYVNILDRPRVLLTGMTRDGTFRIRSGRVVGALRNMRFTESVLDALASVRAVGAEARAFAPEYGSFGSSVAPALLVGSFRFTSTTTH
jgi:PmbA protein